MGQSFDETQVFEDKDYFSEEESKERRITITTADVFLKTGEIPSIPFSITAWIQTDINTGVIYVSDLFNKIDMLKAEISDLKIGYNKLNQRINELFPKSDFIEIKELSEKKIEKIILKYLRNNRDKTIYPSDIAFINNLNAKKVFDICQKLKKEGKID